MYKILHIPTATYVICYNYSDYIGDFDTYEEAEYILTKDSKGLMIVNDQAYIIKLNSFTYNKAKKINIHEFEIIEVDDDV